MIFGATKLKHIHIYGKKVDVQLHFVLDTFLNAYKLTC